MSTVLKLAVFDTKCRELAEELRAELNLKDPRWRFDFSYFNHRWQITKHYLEVITQEESYRAKNSHELKAMSTTLPIVEDTIEENKFTYVLTVRGHDYAIFVMQAGLRGLRPPGSYSDNW